MCLAGSLRAKKQSSVILRDAQFSNDGALYGEGGRETKGEGRALGFREARTISECWAAGTTLLHRVPQRRCPEGEP